MKSKEILSAMMQGKRLIKKCLERKYYLNDIEVSSNEVDELTDNRLIQSERQLNGIRYYKPIFKSN